jgi:hypothetical protein
MFGKTQRMKDLAARRQMLVLESDLNRQLLLREWHGIRQEFHGLTAGLGSLGSLASLAAQVGAASTDFLNGIPRNNRRAAGAKSSLVSSVLHAVRMGRWVWSVLHPPKR